MNFNATNGISPLGGLTIGSDGNFYGTTRSGGASGYGTVFTMTPAGELTTLVSFNSSNGATPLAGVIQGSDGNFYGTTSAGGTSNLGTVFRVTPDGELMTLVNFDSSNGDNPSAGLTLGGDGNFYGTTYSGGTSGYGTVFQVTPSGALTTLYTFDGLIAANPRCAPIFGEDGNLYGTANQMVIWRIVFVPTVSTETASSIGLDGATISGTVAPDRTDATVVFEYGTDTAYGTTISATPGTVSGTSGATAVSASLTGLSPHTPYHYRVDATNTAGTSSGVDATFTTANTPPTAGSSTANLNTGDAVTITLPFALTDVDGDSVTVQSISASDGAPFMLGTVTGDTVQVTASLNAVGTGTINFTVTDGFGGTADGSVTITVVDSLPPVFTSVPSDITVEAPVGTRGAVVNYSAATATDNVGVASLTVNYPSGSTFPIGQTVVQYTAADAAGNAAHVSFSVTVLSGDAAADALGIKGTAVAGEGISAGAMWSGFGVPCATGSGDAFFTATLKVGKVSEKGIVLLDGATGNVSALVQTGSAVPELSGAMFSAFKDPLAVNTVRGEEAMVYLATISGKGVSASNNQVVVRNRLNNGAIVKTDLLGQNRMTIDYAGAKVSRFTSLGLGSDGTVWASVALAQGVGGVTASNNLALLGWVPGVTTPVEVLRKGEALLLSDGKKHVVSTIATLASASGSPGQGRWEGPHNLIIRIGFVDGAVAVMTTTSAGTVTEVARKGRNITLLDSTGAVEAAGAQWSSFGLPSVDLDGVTTLKATLAANVAGVTSENATGLFRLENGSLQWTTLARTGDSTGLSDHSTFSSFSDPVSNAGGTVAFVATQLAGKVKTMGLWNSALTNPGVSASRELTQIAAVHQTAPETGGALFANFVSVALPEWENAGPLFVATLQSGPAGTASHGKVTAANKTGLWAVDFNGNLRLLLRAGSPLPGAAVGSPAVKAFSVLQAVPGSTGQTRATDGQYEVFCNVTYANGTTAVVKVQVP